MHTIHVILVPGRIEKLMSDPGFLDNVLGSCVSPWFDWYQVGGRWDGYFQELFPNIALKDPNILPLEGNLSLAEQVFRDVEKRQDWEFLNITSALKGSTVTAVEDTEGHIFGFPVTRDEASAARMTKMNQATAQEWQGILNAGSLSEIDPYTNMSLYHVSRLTSLATGKWCPDSGFYDCVSETSSVRYAREIFSTANAEDYSLVAVDFHY